MNFHPEYSSAPKKYLDTGTRRIASFIDGGSINADEDTVKSFGEEWNKFHDFSDEDLQSAGSEYFDIVPPDILNASSLVLDLGCGSGRWSYYIADRVAAIEAVDPSLAVLTASELLSKKSNVRVTQATADGIPFADNTFDFLLCLGVLHHIPDTQKALTDAGSKLKTGGHALLYFYYNLENRGVLYKLLFKLSHLLRMVISSLPSAIKKPICDLLAILLYMPLVSLARVTKFLFSGRFYKKLPLSYYANKSFRIIRNDALDRFGTPLEKRYSQSDIEQMCVRSKLAIVRFSEHEPYWHVLVRKA